MTPDDVNKFTSFVVVNAVYFRANWLKQFQSENTEIRSFHGLKGTGDVEMMTQHNVFKTGEFGCFLTPFSGLLSLLDPLIIFVLNCDMHIFA